MRCNCLAIVLLISGLRANASPLDDLWNDPAVEQRIEAGIRANRMGDVVLKLTDSDGKPLPNVTARIEQTQHAFLFGANLFMLDGYPTQEQNRRFEDAYRSLFNAATVPFYWSDLEPEPGKLRFAKDSPPLYRRPPPDVVVAYGRQHGLELKGHPLVWHQFYPKWRPDDPQEAMRRIEVRIAEIADRYGATIPRWEVVNEPMERHTAADPWCNLPEDYVFQSLTCAAKAFPAKTRLLLNEATTFSWLEFKGTDSPFYRLIRAMLDRGARVDEIGMQMHIFSDKAWQSVLAGQRFAPAELFNVLDRYGDFGRPIHITEITIPTLPLSPEGERDQAAVARNFYRLWFSHPRVEAISWWNLADGTAYKGEDKLNGGLLHADLTPKPVYAALDRLINHDWKTSLESKSTMDGTVAFRGFHGNYSITAQYGGKTLKQTFRIERGVPNEWVVKF